jgi:hypothetical protein
MSSAVNLSKMLFDNTNFRTSYVATARSVSTLAAAPAPTPAPVLSSRRNINPAFHLSRFISNATNTGPCKACGS